MYSLLHRERERETARERERDRLWVVNGFHKVSDKELCRFLEVLLLLLLLPLLFAPALALTSPLESHGQGRKL